MKKRSKILILSLFLLFGIGFGIGTRLGAGQSTNDDHHAHSASKLTDIQEMTLFNEKGEKQTLADLVEKSPVLVNFWATWCLPCVREMSLLQEVSQLQKEVEVISISYESADVIEAFINEYQFDYNIVRVDEESASDLFTFIRKNGNPSLSLPFSIILGEKGVIYRKIGEFKTKEEIIDFVDV